MKKKLAKKATYFVFLFLALIGLISWILDLTQDTGVHLIDTLFSEYMDIVFRYWAVVAGGVALSGFVSRIPAGGYTRTVTEDTGIRKQGKIWSLLVFLIVTLVGCICLFIDKYNGTQLNGYLTTSFSSLATQLWDYWMIVATGVGLSGAVNKFGNNNPDNPFKGNQPNT